jgi:hypothetical protein
MVPGPLAHTRTHRCSNPLHKIAVFSYNLCTSFSILKVISSFNVKSCYIVLHREQWQEKVNTCSVWIIFPKYFQSAIGWIHGCTSHKTERDNWTSIWTQVSFSAKIWLSSILACCCSNNQSVRAIFYEFTTSETDKFINTWTRDRL